MANNTEDYIRACQQVYNLLRADNRKGALAKLPARGIECEHQVERAVDVLRDVLGQDDLPE